MLTRAKNKLIMVGNPQTLIKDQMWRKFINYCDTNNAFVGKLFKKKPMEVSYPMEHLSRSLKDLELFEKKE